jgi:probable phosphoglycerate mutase
MTTILLVRHGENEWVRKHRLAGWIKGVHLNENGKKQATQAAARLSHLPVTAVYSSPVERCMETAVYIAKPHELDIVELPKMGEVRYGKWEGEKISKLAKKPLWSVVQFFPSRMRFPEGETMRGVQTRAVNALEKLSEKHQDEMIVVCSHADVIKLTLAHYLGVHIDLFQRVVISPASVSVIQLPANGRVRVLRINDTGLLEAPPVSQPKPPTDKKPSKGRK